MKLRGFLLTTGILLCCQNVFADEYDRLPSNTAAVRRVVSSLMKDSTTLTYAIFEAGLDLGLIIEGESRALAYKRAQHYIRMRPQEFLEFIESDVKKTFMAGLYLGSYIDGRLREEEKEGAAQRVINEHIGMTWDYAKMPFLSIGIQLGTLLEGKSKILSQLTAIARTKPEAQRDLVAEEQKNSLFVVGFDIGTMLIGEAREIMMNSISEWVKMFSGKETIRSIPSIRGDEKAGYYYNLLKQNGYKLDPPLRALGRLNSRLLEKGSIHADDFNFILNIGKRDLRKDQKRYEDSLSQMASDYVVRNGKIVLSRRKRDSSERKMEKNQVLKKVHATGRDDRWHLPLPKPQTKHEKKGEKERGKYPEWKIHGQEKSPEDRWKTVNNSCEQKPANSEGFVAPWLEKLRNLKACVHQPGFPHREGGRREQQKHGKSDSNNETSSQQGQGRERFHSEELQTKIEDSTGILPGSKGTHRNTIFSGFLGRALGKIAPYNDTENQLDTGAVNGTTPPPKAANEKHKALMVNIVKQLPRSMSGFSSYNQENDSLKITNITLGELSNFKLTDEEPFVQTEADGNETVSRNIFANKLTLTFNAEQSRLPVSAAVELWMHNITVRLSVKINNKEALRSNGLALVSFGNVEIRFIAGAGEQTGVLKAALETLIELVQSHLVLMVNKSTTLADQFAKVVSVVKY